MPFKIHQTSIQGVLRIENLQITDNRGSFSRYFCKDELISVINDREIKQINFSNTCTVGAIRGLHYQYPPFAEMKLIRCLQGRVWDVAVDLRIDSPTYLHWHAEELSPEANLMMVIPEGCAHGFQVLHENSQLLYLHTEFYSPENEGGLRYDEPQLRISWLLPVVDVSNRDMAHPLIDEGFKGIKL